MNLTVLDDSHQGGKNILKPYIILLRNIFL